MCRRKNMVRDMDLIRNILLNMEAGLDVYDGIEVSGTILLGHLNLMEEARLIDGSVIKWEGYEFLESVRDEGTWIETKRKAIDILKNASFEALKAITAGAVQGAVRAMG